MLLRLAFFVFVVVCTVVATATDRKVEQSPAKVSTELTIRLPSSQQPSSSLSEEGTGRRRPRGPWTAEHREKYAQTIATRIVTQEMKAAWSNGTLKGIESRRQALSLGLPSSQLKRKPWTQEHHEKFRQRIESRNITEETRKKWSNRRRGQLVKKNEKDAVASSSTPSNVQRDAMDAHVKEKNVE